MSIIDFCCVITYDYTFFSKKILQRPYGVAGDFSTYILTIKRGNFKGKLGFYKALSPGWWTTLEPFGNEFNKSFRGV